MVWVSKNGRQVEVRRDTAILDPNFKPEIIPGGFVGHCINQNEQSYTYEENLNGQVSRFSLRKWRGLYVWTAKGTAPGGRQELSKGRKKFHDYNF